MPTTIKLKNGSGAPLAGDLVQGEPALDLTNKRLYTEDAGGNVIEVGTSPSTIDINAGSIDGVTLGTNSAVTSAVITTADINGGTLDNVVIGGSTPAAGSFTTVTGSGDMNIDSGTLFVDASENRVGIGTSSPSSFLEVVGSGVVDSTIARIKGGSAAGNRGIEISNDSVGNVEIQAIRATDNTTGFQLSLNPDGGNVGIGTSSPQKPLQIFGQVGQDAGIAFTNSISGESATDGLLVTLNSDGTNATFWNYENGYMRFATNSTERMRIDSDGNLLINSTTSAQGSSREYIYIAASRASEMMVLEHVSTNNRNHIHFRNPNGIVGVIGTNGSATYYNTSSDYRLKEDWVPMSDSIARVKALNPVNFAWKVDGTRVDGFLAHEAQEVVPEAVTGEKDAVDKDGKPDYQGIDQAKLVPLLTAALQEAIGRIETLEAEVAALKGA